MPGLRLFLLGPLDIQYDGQRVPKPPTQKSQSLFAYLALHRQRPQPREHLAGMFWGDRPERKARRSLTTALWHIRRALPEAAAFLAGPQTVQLDPQAELWLDVDDFEGLAGYQDLTRLQAAAGLYRGDFLEGFYDDWVLSVRYRLDTLFGDVLTRLMASQEAAGEHQAALVTARRLLDHDPLREDAHRLAVRAFCRLGQRAAAMEQYRRCQEVVQDELNAGAMVETTELYGAILEGRFEIGSAEEAMPPRAVEDLLPPATGYDPLEATSLPPLVGREQEIAFLQDRYAEAGQGRGGLVLISGEAGVGKTRLVDELTRQLRWRGDCVLSGRCYEFERFLPYQPVAEALGGVVPAMSQPGLEAHPAWVLAEVARLVPELLEKVPGLDATPALRSGEERLRLFEGLLRFLAHLSTQGRLLLVLEDLHWATESTLQLVHYLARHLAANRVLLLATFRPEALGRRHPLQALRQELGREGLLAPLRLDPLSLPAVETLVAEMSGGGAATVPLARRLYTETEGNPFFLMELVRALFERQYLGLEEGRWQGDFARISQADLPLPAGVSETIRARVRWLEDEVQEVLPLVAVLGREFDFELLDALWGRDEEATLEALDVLLRRRLIEEGTGALGRDYAFTHHKIQEVIYADLPLRRRQRLHAQAGLAMERLYGPQAGDWAAELAFHFQEGAAHDGQLRDKAIQYLLQAGDQARWAQAHHEAAGHYQQALTSLKRQRQHESAARTLMKLGLTYHASLDYARAREAYDEGFILWQRAARDEPGRRLPPAQTLRSWQVEPVTLDPGLVTDWHSGVVMEQLFSCLVRFGPNMEVLPEAATGWEILEGGYTYRFHLRQDGRWSDGTPVTARDFGYAWKRFLHPSRPRGPGPSFYNVRGARAYHQGEVSDPDSVAVRCADEYTLVVELEAPDPSFLHLTLYAVPVPRHQVEVFGDAWAEPGRLVSNGPFRLESWQAGESLVLARNPHYAGRFEGNLQRVELSFAPPAAAMDAYEADRLDVVGLDFFPPADMDRLRHQHSGEYLSVPDLSTYYLRYDLSRPPFHDRRVRRAFALATDRSRLADLVLGGHVFPATGGQVPPGMGGHSPGIALPYRPPEARQLLAEAGYPGGRGFPPVELLLPEGREAVVEDLAAQWLANLGVPVAGRALPWAALLARAYGQPPHILGMASGAHYPDPATFVGAARRDEEQAAYAWQHAGYDRLAGEAAQAMDEGQRLELFQEMDRIVVEEAWMVPLWYGRRHLLVKPWVVRLPTSPIMGCFWKDVIADPHPAGS
jgi:ABC-type oligopeptide transport system substrate-binding subunit/DNA-binding SARP family transcriptional activator